MSSTTLSLSRGSYRSSDKGVFTHYLLEGLRGKADLDGDGVITVDELYAYVSKKVPEATGQNQNPVKKGKVEEGAKMRMRVMGTHGLQSSLIAIRGVAALALGLAAGLDILGAPPVAAQTGLPDLAVLVEWSTMRVVVGGSLSLRVSISNDRPGPLGPVPAGAVVNISITNGTIRKINTVNSGFTCADAYRTPLKVSCRRNMPMEPGSAVELTVDVQAPSQPGMINATAVASLPISIPDLDPNNNSMTRPAQVFLALQPDLTVSIVGLPDPVVGLSDVAYSLDVKNVGSGDATGGVLVQHTLPPGATFVSASAPSPWNCSHAGRVVRCVVSSHPAGRITHINVVSKAPLGPGSLTYTVFVNPVGGELSERNNSDSVTRTNVGAPDLKPVVTSVTWYIPDFPGASMLSTSTAGVTLQINVENVGPGPAGPTTLRIELPPLLANFVNADDPVNVPLLARRVTWNPEGSRNVSGPRPRCSLSPSVATCSIPELAGGASTGTTDIFAILLHKIKVTLESVPVPFTVTADTGSILSEQDESNNLVIRTVNVVCCQGREIRFACTSNNDCASTHFCRDGVCVRK